MSAECHVNTYRVTNFNIGFSDHLSSMAREISEGTRGAIHYVWLVPATLFSTALGLFFATMLAAVNLAVGAFFTVMSFFASDPVDRLWNKQMAIAFIGAAGGQLTDIPLTLIARVFFPAIERQYVVTRAVGECVSRMLCTESARAEALRQSGQETFERLTQDLPNWAAIRTMENIPEAISIVFVR